MKYKNKVNGFIIDSKIALSGVWEPYDGPRAKAACAPASDTPDDTWDFAALKAYAAQHDIDIGKERSKKGLLALIVEAAGPPVSNVSVDTGE